MTLTSAGLSFDDVRYFLEVSQVGTITRAAERLGLSQPSVSAAVQRLERSLGCELLVRSKTGVALTREGALLVARGRSLLADWNALGAAVLRQRDEPSGRFTIGCHPTIAAHWLPATLPSLLTRWPKLEVSVVHDLSRRINDLVVSHGLDFGLVVNPLRHPDLVVTPLSTDVFTAWMRPRAPADVALYDADLRQAQTLLGQLERSGRRFRRAVTSSSLELLARLAANGAGVALLPTHLAERTSPRLRLLPNAPQVLDRICLVYRADAQRSPGARAVITALREVKPGAR